MKEQSRVFEVEGESCLPGASTSMKCLRMDKEKIFCKKALKGEMKKISLQEEMEWGDSRFNLYRYRRNMRK